MFKILYIYISRYLNVSRYKITMLTELYKRSHLFYWSMQPEDTLMDLMYMFEYCAWIGSPRYGVVSYPTEKDLSTSFKHFKFTVTNKTKEGGLWSLLFITHTSP